MGTLVIMKIKNSIVLAIIAVFSLASLLLCPLVGITMISPFRILDNCDLCFVLLTIRIPRTIAAFLCGGGLAVAGMVYQAIFRNALACPYTLGVSSGASLGAALCIVLGAGSGIAGLSATSFGALIGALASILFIYGFAWNKENNSGTILLAGVIVGSVCSGLIMLIYFVNPIQQSFQILHWIMGGVDGTGYGQLLFLIVPLFLYLLLLIIMAPHLDHFLTGDSIAHSRGVNVTQSRNILIVATAIVVGAIVTVSGPIGFVGIIAPHVCRMLMPKTRHRKLAVCSFLLGGTFLVLSDTVARSIAPPSEIPVGIITALLGGPFFLFVLLKTKKAALW